MHVLVALLAERKLCVPSHTHSVLLNKFPPAPHRMAVCYAHVAAVERERQLEIKNAQTNLATGLSESSKRSLTLDMQVEIVPQQTGAPL